MDGLGALASRPQRREKAGGGSGRTVASQPALPPSLRSMLDASIPSLSQDEYLARLERSLLSGKKGRQGEGAMTVTADAARAYAENNPPIVDEREYEEELRMGLLDADELRDMDADLEEDHDDLPVIRAAVEAEDVVVAYRDDVINLALDQAPTVPLPMEELPERTIRVVCCSLTHRQVTIALICALVLTLGLLLAMLNMARL